MATRLDKIMEPILKEKCDKAFRAGYRKGVDAAWIAKNRAYENEIESLKFSLNRQRLLTCPTVDTVPVVRCKDCIWFNKPGCAIYIVDDTDKPKDDDFCSYGERRTDNG